MTSAEDRRGRSASRELIVPGIMLAIVGAYWTDAGGLSAEARALPMSLTAVLVLAIAAIVVPRLLRPGAMRSGDLEEGADTNVGAVLFAKAWIVVLLPLPLIYFWRDVGALPMLLAYALGVLFFLGERRPVWLLCLPTVLATLLVYLFKTVLYVRLPDIPWAFGA